MESTHISQEAVEIEPERPGSLRQYHPAVLLALILIYLSAWAFTRAHFMADTNVYTQAILRHQSGGGSADYHSVNGNPFWDFGHILWRPFGWLCFRLTQAGTQVIEHGNLRGEVLVTLFGINFLASLAGVISFFNLARRVIGDEWSALAASVGFFSGDAFLNYAHSGNAYVVGLACLVVGMWLLWERATGPGLSRSVAAGVLLALAVLFWLPYLFVLPAAILAPLVLYGYDKRQRRLVMQAVVACAAVGFAVYGSAIAILGIRNWLDLRGWIVAAGHGQIQPPGLRAMARLAFSLPRSFVNMDRDGMWLKRYLDHDPYAPVTMGTLFSLSLWKLGLFYASAGVVAYELLRSKPGRVQFLLLAATVLPIFIFAIFIFEAGSIERYLPLYPFIFLAFGAVLASKQTRSASKAVLLIALAAIFAVNVHAMGSGVRGAQRAAAVARIRDLIPLLRPNSLVLAVNEQDNLAEFRQNFPLDPINLESEWRTYDVLEINTERLATWREDFAKRVIGAWRHGGTVWLPLRFLSAQPRPEWNWVEGDDKRVRWTDLPAFFSKFQTGQAVGGEDGFVLLQDSPGNREILEALGPTIPGT